MAGGQTIAVKRLGRNSGQGIPEFRNELIVMPKLQHVNIVKIIGCCIHGEERMLVYEYMPNKSLDCFLFGKKNIDFYLELPLLIFPKKKKKLSLLYHFLETRLLITSISLFIFDRLKEKQVIRLEKTFQYN